MADVFSENLKEIFSILPEGQAEEARQQSLQKFLGDRDFFKDQLKWANFDEMGAFKDGGISDIGGYSTRPVNNKNEDPDILRLAQLVADGGAEAGRIELNMSGDLAYWFLPTLKYDEINEQESGLRGFVLTSNLFCEVIKLFNAGRNLTAAEYRLAFQIVSGLSLREAAQLDGVAFETKRSQLKSTCSKMQCNGQTELVRLLVSQMTHLLNVSEIKQINSELLQKFVQNYLVPDTRIFFQRLPNGRTLRILELGPTTGVPVLLIHGMFWPIIFTEPSSLFSEYNLRLIVPIRSGYAQQYSSADAYGKDDLVAQSLEDIALYHRLFIGEPMSVVGFGLGGAAAIEYAYSNDKLVNKLFVISINVGNSNEANSGYIGRLFSGLQSIANKRGAFRFISWQFKKYYADKRVVRGVLKRLFAGSPSDSNLLEGRSSGRSMYPWFVDLYQSSIPGIADDFSFAMGDWEQMVTSLDIPVAFFHGADDPVENCSKAQQLCETCMDSNIEILDGAGNLLIATHAEQIWRKIADNI